MIEGILFGACLALPFGILILVLSVRKTERALAQAEADAETAELKSQPSYQVKVWDV